MKCRSHSASRLRISLLKGSHSEDRLTPIVTPSVGSQQLETREMRRFETIFRVFRNQEIYGRIHDADQLVICCI